MDHDILDTWMEVRRSFAVVFVKKNYDCIIFIITLIIQYVVVSIIFFIAFAAINLLWSVVALIIASIVITILIAFMVGWGEQISAVKLLSGFLGYRTPWWCCQSILWKTLLSSFVFEPAWKLV